MCVCGCVCVSLNLFLFISFSSSLWVHPCCVDKVIKEHIHPRLPWGTFSIWLSPAGGSSIQSVLDIIPLYEVRLRFHCGSPRTSNWVEERRIAEGVGSLRVPGWPGWRMNTMLTSIAPANANPFKFIQQIQPYASFSPVSYFSSSRHSGLDAFSGEEMTMV